MDPLELEGVLEGYLLLEGDVLLELEGDVLPEGHLLLEGDILLEWRVLHLLEGYLLLEGHLHYTILSWRHAIVVPRRHAILHCYAAAA